MAFSRNFVELERFVKEVVSPYAKSQLEAYALQYLNSGPVLTNIHTGLLLRGTASLQLSLKFREFKMGFDPEDENTMVWFVPPSIPDFAKTVDYRLVVQRTILDIQAKREILDRVVKRNFSFLEVTDIYHLEDTSRYTIRK